jgi:SAM-dependent methyltransferase
MDLPGIGTVPGAWTLVDIPDKYLGGVDLRGKSVLEIGAASGALTLAMERGGANVTAFDLSPAYPPDNLYLSSAVDREKYLRDYKDFQAKMNNSFWLTHKLHGLKARMVHGTVYSLPAELGSFDVGTICCVLQHLRDPFQALHNVLSHTKDTAIITEWYAGEPRRGLRRLSSWVIREVFGIRTVGNEPVVAFFLPKPDETHHKYSWWILPPDTLTRMLNVLGFEVQKTTVHNQFLNGNPQLLYTTVARRTGPGYRSL